MVSSGAVLVKANPAAIVLDRAAWKKEAGRLALFAGVGWGGSMALIMGILGVVAGGSLTEVLAVLGAFLVGGVAYAAFMFPFLLLMLRPVQHVLPADSAEDAAAMVEALHAGLLKLRFALVSEDVDYRHYHSARRIVSKVVQIRVLLLEDRLVILGPAAAVRGALGKSKLWKRRQR